MIEIAKEVAVADIHAHKLITCCSIYTFRRLATYVVTAFASVHLVFYTDYNIPNYEGKHVFSDLQVWYRNWVDRTVWGRKELPSSEGQPSEKKEK